MNIKLAFDAFLGYVRRSEFWSTLLLWFLIAGVCIVVANVVAAAA